MSKLTVVIICLIVIIIVVCVLIALAFRAAYKNDLKKQGVKYLWCDRKRNWLGLPWSFTKYSVSEDRIFLQKGLLKTTYDEVRLYRILDVKMSQTFWQKIINVGTVTLHSSDKSLGCFSLLNVKNPMSVKELISGHVETQRDKHRVYSRESMSDQSDEYDEHDDFDGNN